MNPYSVSGCIDGHRPGFAQIHNTDPTKHLFVVMYASHPIQSNRDHHHYRNSVIPGVYTLFPFPFYCAPFFFLLSLFSTLAELSQSTSAASNSGCPFFSSLESKKPSLYPRTIRSSRSEVDIQGVRRVGKNLPKPSASGHFLNSSYRGLLTHPALLQKHRHLQPLY